MTLSKVGEFHKGYLWGKYLIYCVILLKFRLRVRLKLSHDRGKFELDLAIFHLNIAENSFSLGHETDTRLAMSVLLGATHGFLTPILYQDIAK